MAKALAAIALASFILGAQNQPPIFKARIDLVQVDVVVVDKHDNPVRGLTAADFTLRDRGKPQAIVNFDEVSHAAARARAIRLPPSVRRDVADNQIAQADRLVVMVVDDLHIYKDRTDRAKEIARKVVDDLGPQSSMAVLFTSGDHSTQVTADQHALRSAVGTLRGRQSWRRPHQAVDAQTPPVVGPGDSMEVALAKAQQAADTRVQDFFDNITQYKLLQDAARMLGAGDGRRKAFVMISEGIGKDLSGLFGAMAPPGQPPQGGTEYASGNIEALTQLPPNTYHDFALIDMMESLRRSNVATYAIDPRGRVESKDLMRECFPAPHPGDDPCSNDMAEWHSDVRLAQHGLEIMSEASGGFAVTNTDDFTSGLDRIVNDLDHYYLLGFYPSDTKGKNYRTIDVRIPGRPDVKLRFRHGYMPGGPPAAPKNSSELVALSAGVLPKTALALRLGAIATPGTGAGARVLLVLEVTAPRVQLEEKDGRLHDTLKYEVLVVDEKKAKVRSISGLEAALTLSPNLSAGSLPEMVVYEVADTVDMAPGHYEFRVSATSAKLRAGGSVYLGVEVPHFHASAPVLGGLSIGYADGARIPLAPRSQSAALRAARMTTAAPVWPFPPTLDRVFEDRDTLHVYVEAVARAAARLTVSMDVVDATGKIVRSPSPSFTSGDPIRIQSAIPLRGLAPGAYILRATIADGEHAAAVREAGFAIK